MFHERIKKSQLYVTLGKWSIKPQWKIEESFLIRTLTPSHPSLLLFLEIALQPYIAKNMHFVIDYL